MCNKRILPCNALPRNNRLAARRQAPPARPKRAVQDPAIFDLGQVDDAVGLALNIVEGDGREQDIRSFFGEGLRGQSVERPRPVDLTIALIEDQWLVREPVAQVRYRRFSAADGGLCRAGTGLRGLLSCFGCLADIVCRRSCRLASSCRE